jgi:hypothetical protein
MGRFPNLTNKICQVVEIYTSMWDITCILMLEHIENWGEWWRVSTPFQPRSRLKRTIIHKHYKSHHKNDRLCCHIGRTYVMWHLYQSCTTHPIWTPSRKLRGSQILHNTFWKSQFRFVQYATIQSKWNI